MKKLPLIVLISAALIVFCSSLMSATQEETFFRANEAYKNSDYVGALILYKELASKENPSGHVLFNLGNTFYRLGDLGNAVLNYEKARLTLPRDADVEYNLSYVRGKCRDALEPPAKPFQSVFFWTDSFSLNELFWIFAAANLIFFTALVLRRLARREWTFTIVIVMLLIWLATGSSFGVKLYQDFSTGLAVVTSQEVNVLSGPDPGDTNLFKLHAGTIVETEKKEAGWSLIRISDGRRGWVENNSIGFVTR